MAYEKHPLDTLSVYADLFSLQDEQCVELIRQKIAENTPLTDEDYRIIAVERLRGVKRLRIGKYVAHLLDDPNGFFSIQAWANSIPGSSSISVTPRTDEMTPESQQIIERITKASPTPVFKSAFHPDFDNN